jgi:hypothetical protein
MARQRIRLTVMQNSRPLAAEQVRSRSISNVARMSPFIGCEDRAYRVSLGEASTYPIYLWG